ncbi:hypothetical protein [Asticcacaulis sp. YBE204]|uniref:hypothetical protein n=1 Tax=Asticcacaulis sp. YBE204 TaxID=1282363 RepID=UPI0003C3E424|nr:hypothetical protein [Asticcacaulis sp. YBE204]ESQ80200.1 hypothetical protein AEYBE204_06155 [Asticcacaulis sp. YBE204]
MQMISALQIDETERGLVIDIDSWSKLVAFQTIVLSAKFPETGTAKAEVLLSPFVEQLVDACREKLAKEEPWPAGHHFASDDPFVLAVTATVDEYIQQHDLHTERQTLLIRALKPHTVEGLN